MTISKEKFEAIALEVASDVPWTTAGIHGKRIIYFTHALIKRVEAESEIIGVVHEPYQDGSYSDMRKTVALPLVAEE